MLSIPDWIILATDSSSACSAASSFVSRPKRCLADSLILCVHAASSYIAHSAPKIEFQAQASAPSAPPTASFFRKTCISIEI
jgi:hypothetical protein